MYSSKACGHHARQTTCRMLSRQWSGERGKGMALGCASPQGVDASPSCVIPTHIQMNCLGCPGPADLAAGKERYKTRIANGYFDI